MEPIEPVLRYRGREIGTAEVISIRELIAEHPEMSRRALSLALCEAWNWKQENAAPRDAICRGLLLALDRAGHIRLPPPRHASPCPAFQRRRPSWVEVANEPLEASLRELGPITIRQVRRSPEEALVNGLIEQHHYLRYSQPVGPVAFCLTSLTA
jgi:hypothetical protein